VRVGVSPQFKRLSKALEKEGRVSGGGEHPHAKAVRRLLYALRPLIPPQSTTAEQSGASDDAGPSEAAAAASAVDADPSAVDADPSAVDADPSAVDADPSAVDADPSETDVDVPAAAAAHAHAAHAPAAHAAPAGLGGASGSRALSEKQASVVREWLVEFERHFGAVHAHGEPRPLTGGRTAHGGRLLSAPSRRGAGGEPTTRPTSDEAPSTSDEALTAHEGDGATAAMSQRERQLAALARRGL
jgi:hypothetical protein